MLPATTDVLVVGAGPTGLTVAVGLARLGRHVTVVDGQAEGANTTRAAVVHARTLEVLEPYGVVDALVSRGLRATGFSIRDRDRVLVPVPFGGLPTAYPYTLMISQEVTEAVLLARLTELGGRVLRPYTVTGVEQDEAGATVTFAGGESVRAAYVVGADGMHSTVREQAGIAFTGEAYAESFSLADVRLSGGVPQDEVVLYFSPAGVLVVAPLPGGSYRIVATVPEAPRVPDVAFVQRLLDDRGPEAGRAVVREVVWGSRFQVHHRVADAYRAGRILLAGDAAHVHSPAGGQGMNAGITDGVALATALDAVLGGGSPGLLDAYGAVRRPVAQQIVSLADRITRLATVDRRFRPARNLALRLLAALPAFRRQLAWRLSGLVYR
ncbi:FAD-dependent monooxygenase [Herbidospora cretacea]|uniref:FAD-dependent monooxygenase n=1 Tax=Herbidospora cretacea TaxID=28444 RepID=UPI000773BD87|nr:FAD-dependent monooxygenase [Herbidospora cretacea]